MAEIQGSENSESSQTQASLGSTSVGNLNIGRDVGGNVTVGNNNVINYYAAVASNTEKHDPDYWALKHPYPMPPNFTGRIAERALLTHWLKEDSENRLFILRALGGFGKSALAWQWLTHDVDIKEYPKVLFWSFYEGDASFEHFIEETLKYLKLDIPQGQRPQVDELLKAMQSQKILLIMDGFERALRAYSSMNAAYQGDEEPKHEDNQLDCVNINAEFFLRGVCSLPNIKSKVLMTTRLTPHAVKPRGEIMLGCREVELTSMQPADAVEFFRKQKIKGAHAEIEAACAPYGYHPLSLRLLAGRILKDFDNPADIVVAQKLKIDGDIIQQKHHVLEISYNSLPRHGQKMLSVIACFRSPVELKTLEVIAKDVGATHESPLQDDLHDLVERGLLYFNEKNKKFDLHPIVRRYTYEHLKSPDRIAAHKRLFDYFAAIDVPEKMQTLDDLAPVIELYHHTTQAGEFDEAYELFETRLNKPLYYQLGAYTTIIELLSALFLDEEGKLSRLKEESAQAWSLTVLAHAYSASGQPRRAVLLYEQSIAIREKEGNKKSLANGWGNLAKAQIYIGALSVAESNLRRRIELYHEITSELDEATGHRDLGRLLLYRGAWNEAEQEYDLPHKLFNNKKYIQPASVFMAYRSLGALLMIRDTAQSLPENRKLAIEYAERALELAEARARTSYPLERDFIRAHWFLGAALRINSQFDIAEFHLNEALTRDRVINYVADEADILLDLARLCYDQKQYEEAKSLADEALLITERCGYVLQGADVNLFLAQYALEQERDKVKAKQYAEEAKKLATCDGPPYYYKVAYEEAERFLAKLQG